MQLTYVIGVWKRNWGTWKRFYRIYLLFFFNRVAKRYFAENGKKKEISTVVKDRSRPDREHDDKVPITMENAFKGIFFLPEIYFYVRLCSYYYIHLSAEFNNGR